MVEVSPDSLLSGTLASYGLSLVLRTEDVWQRYIQCIEVCGALNQGFPFSPLKWRPMMVPKRLSQQVRKMLNRNALHSSGTP